jgi:ligand-binding sensor domain-containing protein
MLVFCTSREGQNKPDLPKQNVKSEAKDSIISQVPNSMVRNIKRARNGDILIASFLGVFRYDGKSFTNLTSKINSPSFWDVLEDRKGNLWLATRDSGVYYYNGKSFQHFTTREGIASNMVFSIYEDKKGSIWFGTAAGASLYNGKSFRNSKEMLFLEDKTGKLWFSTGDGARIYDGKTFTVLKNKDGKPFKNVRSVIEDKKGNIWLSEVDGLWRYDGSTLTKVSQKGAYALLEDKKGNIWTTAEVKPNGDWALFRYDQKSLSDKKPIVTDITSKYEGYNKNCLFGILEANDGSIWVGGLDGVYRYDGNTFKNLKRK